MHEDNFDEVSGADGDDFEPGQDIFESDGFVEFDNAGGLDSVQDRDDIDDSNPPPSRWARGSHAKARRDDVTTRELPAGDGQPLDAAALAPEGTVPRRDIRGGRDAIGRAGKPTSRHCPILGLDDYVEALVDELSLRDGAGLVCIVGEPGSGKTSALHALRDALRHPARAGSRSAHASIVEIDGRSAPPHALAERIAKRAERNDRLVALVDDTEEGDLQALANRVYAWITLTRPDDRGRGGDVRVVFTLDSATAKRFKAEAPNDSKKIAFFEVPALPESVIRAIAETAGAELAAHHGVALGAGVIEEACVTSRNRPLRPQAVRRRLDQACVRAARRPERIVTVDDVCVRRDVVVDYKAAIATLSAAVIGQDHVIEPVVRRLVLTTSGLALNPEKPIGKFLFVGPTGVGKTELARQLAEFLYGADNCLIRLDMSEFSDQWSISRLIGPPPGYQGHTQPDTWLTTNVVEHPHAVIVFDEFEKAHPTVHNLLLQILDAGRLTDGQGVTADFSRTTIVLTSNTGAEAFADESNTIGYHTAAVDPETDRQRREARVRSIVASSLPPELIGRLDGIHVFYPLDDDAITGIVRTALAAHVERIAARGFHVTIDDSVITHLATTGIDRRYGARDVERNIELRLLNELAIRGCGTYTVTFDRDASPDGLTFTAR